MNAGAVNNPMCFHTGDQSLVRDINLSLIMSRLIEHAPLSRAGLAAATGLNKSTVSSLVKQLLDLQFVREVGFNLGSVGRPSVQLEINPDAGHIVSCELAVDSIEVMLANFGAEVIWKRREHIGAQEQQDTIIEQMLALLHEALCNFEARCPGERPLLGLAVGAPGLAREADGTLLFAPNLGWRDVPLRQVLQREFAHVPIFVENEANMAALGEYFFGVAQGYHDVLYLSAGIGLGGAVVRNGLLFKGASGYASEFGHMPLDPDGPLCNCQNRGCWETFVSQHALFGAIRAAVEGGQPSVLTARTDGNLAHLTMSQVLHAAAQGDAVALSALRQIGQYLGIGIASLINALNPDLVVLGGSLSLAGDYLQPVVEAELDQRALRWNRQAAHLAVAQYGTESCVMGGVALVYQHILLRPGNLERWNR